MLPKNFPGEHTVIGIVVDRCGEDSDYGPDPTHAGNMRVAVPGMHDIDNGVQIDHLARSSKERGANADDQCTFPGQSDYGSVVYISKETGRTDCVVRGSPNETFQDGSTPGNNNMLAGKFMELIGRTDGRRIPPNWQEKMVRGAKIREKVEKGKDHSHELLKGLPVHGALYNIAGSQLPQVKQIHTAIEKFSNILTGDMLGQMPGQMMSIGSMLSQVASHAGIRNIMPREVLHALDSMATLAQTGGVIESGGSITAMRVNPEVFINNAVQMFSGVTNVHDLVNATQNMIYDTSLHGMDAYANVQTNSETPFGNTTIVIDPNGSVSEQTSNSVANTAQVFAQSMSSPSSSPGGNSGQNMFGGSAQTMMKMFERMPPNMFQMAKQMSEKLNSQGLGQIFDKLTKHAFAQTGNNPLKIL
jgi:hypothetical protein